MSAWPVVVVEVQLERQVPVAVSCPQSHLLPPAPTCSLRGGVACDCGAEAEPQTDFLWLSSGHWKILPPRGFWFGNSLFTFGKTFHQRRWLQSLRLAVFALHVQIQCCTWILGVFFSFSVPFKNFFSKYGLSFKQFWFLLCPVALMHVCETLKKKKQQQQQQKQTPKPPSQLLISVMLHLWELKLFMSQRCFSSSPHLAVCLLPLWIVLWLGDLIFYLSKSIQCWEEEEAEKTSWYQPDHTVPDSCKSPHWEQRGWHPHSTADGCLCTWAGPVEHPPGQAIVLLGKTGDHLFSWPG